jgi:TetR/AcrR family transcriptional regulator
MVSQPGRRRPRRSVALQGGLSRDRLLAAATEEFAARGFDGAKVDRIARRAGVNKAMLYYHFDSKAAVYREILRGVFQDVADAVARVRLDGGSPDGQLRAYVRAVADHAIARPHFPPLWLRELAEGGRHLDASVVGAMRGVIETLAGILRDGHAAGRFVKADPFITQAGIAAPLLLLAATRTLRDRFRHLMPAGVSPPSLDDAVAHVEAATIAAVTAAPRPARRRPVSRRPS